MTKPFSRRILQTAALVLTLALPQGAAADDRGLLQGFIEDNLSSAGRTVRIEGFRGALSSEAALDLLTIADDDGIWISLKDVKLNWSRLALLRGRLQVATLSAEEVLLPRLPKPDDSVQVPDAESTGFSLPELPVAVNIDEIAVDKIVMGAPVIGEEVSLSLAGSLQLDGGVGDAKLDITRLDRANDKLTLDASYSNADHNLAVDLIVTEEEGGLASKLMNIPGAPSLMLAVQGDAPLSDYTATIGLDTDGKRRLGGTVKVASPKPDPEQPDESRPMSFAVDIRGDIAPVFAPEYRAFFGSDVALVVRGSKPENGGLAVETLSLKAAALTLDGSLQMSGDSWPERFDLTGRLASREGGSVLLPISGPETKLDDVDLSLTYDLAEGEGWRLTLSAKGLEREGLRLKTAALEGGGTIAKGKGSLTGHVDGALALSVTGLGFDDADMAVALGDALQGDIVFDWQEGAPFRLSKLAFEGSDYDVKGEAEIKGLLSKPFEPRATANVRLNAADLSRFAGVAGAGLEGAAQLLIDAAFAPSKGTTDVTVSGTAQDLAVGQPRLDPLLSGKTQLDIAARRNTGGTFLDRLHITSPTTDLTATAALKTGASTAKLALEVQDASLIEPTLKGPAKLTANADQSGDDWTIKAGASGPGEATLTANGTVSVIAGKPGLFDMRASAVASDFSPYSTLAGRDLGGAASVVITAKGNAADLSGQADLVMNGENLSVGIAQIDGLLRGTSSAEASAERSADGALTLSRGLLKTPSINAKVEGYMGADGTARGTADITGTDLRVGIPQADRILRGRSTAQIEALRSADGTISVKRGDVKTPMIDAAVQGFYAANGSAEVDVDVTGRSIALGIPQVDQLLRGASSLKAKVARKADGTLVIDHADLASSQLTARASGTVSTDGSSAATIDARLANVAILAPGMPGAATARGTIRGEGDSYILDIDATGPAGIAADVSGRVNRNGNLNLAVKGTAPLALADPFINPRRMSGLAQIDLRVQGPPALSSLNGTITTRDAGLSLPKLKLALEGIDATIRLTGGAAQIDFGTGVNTGGRVAANGRIGLTAPYQADLAVDLQSVGITDPGLYTTTVDGRITLNGPALGGANIAGTINLGEVNVQVPSGSIASGARLPGLQHINESPAVRRTLAFANMLDDGNGGAAGTDQSGPVYGIDVRINAPARIFIRGRGLDAELGGGLRVRGTTAQVIPEGQFDLLRGRLDLLGKRLELTEGYLQMQGSFVPYLHLVARADSGDVQVIISIDGPADEPRITFSSQPELPEDQVVSQLIFGRDLSQISAFQAVQLASAVATLAGRGGEGLVGNLRKGVGLDNLDVTTGADDTTEVRAGKYLSENLYSEVEVNSDGQSQINLNLDISKSIKAKGSFSAGGDSGLGVFFEKDY